MEIKFYMQTSYKSLSVLCLFLHGRLVYTCIIRKPFIIGQMHSRTERKLWKQGCLQVSFIARNIPKGSL